MAEGAELGEQGWQDGSGTRKYVRAIIGSLPEPNQGPYVEVADSFGALQAAEAGPQNRTVRIQGARLVT